LYALNSNQQHPVRIIWLQPLLEELLLTVYGCLHYLPFENNQRSNQGLLTLLTDPKL